MMFDHDHRVAEFDQLLEHAARAERGVVVERLNRSLSLRRVTTIDFASERVRHEDQDLRDLPRLIAEHGLDDLEALGLDRSGTLIIDRERYVQLNARAGNRGFALRSTGAELEVERKHLGLVPEWLLDGKYDVECRVVDGPSDRALQVVGREGARIAFVILLRPDLGNVMTQLTLFNPSGGVGEDFVASDFREVGGVFVPFHTLQRRTLKGPADHRVERRTVEKVEINPTLPADAKLFEIPEGSRVQDMTEAERAAGAP